MFNVAKKNVLSSTGIAILASLGIHGLLWAVLPGLTVSQADKLPSERTINLVDLSPQEQSRLPQVSNPADNTLPAFASELTALPPLPPTPPYQTSVMPPVQLPPGSTPVYNTPQNSAPAPQTFQGPVPPPPPTNTSFLASPYNNPSNSPNSYPILSGSPASPFIRPANIDQPNLALTPGTFSPDDEIASATPSPEQSLQPGPANQPTPATRSMSRPELAAALRGQQTRTNQPTPATRSMSRPELAAALRGQQTRTNQPTPATRSMSRPELAAALRGQQSRSNQPTPPNTRSMSRQEIAAALRGQNRNLSNERLQEPTIEQDNLDKYTVARAEVQKKYPGVGIKQIRRKLTSCDRALDDLAVVSVVVNPQGKRLSEPVLITPPRRANLTLAQNDVRNYGFTKTGKTTNYIFRVEFDYIASKCAQVKPTPTPTPDSTPAPNLSPVLSSPKPTPTPDSTPAPNLSPALSSPKPTPTPASTPAPNPSPEPTSTPLPLDSNKPSF